MAVGDVGQRCQTLMSISAGHFDRRKFANDPTGLSLLDLGFFELNVLSNHRVIFLEHQLFGAGAGILFGDVKETRSCRGQELNFLRDWLSHGVA